VAITTALGHGTASLRMRTGRARWKGYLFEITIHPDEDGPPKGPDGTLDTSPQTGSLNQAAPGPALPAGPTPLTQAAKPVNRLLAAFEPGQADLPPETGMPEWL